MNLKKGQIIKDSGQDKIIVGIVDDFALLLDFNNNTYVVKIDDLELINNLKNYHDYASSLIYVVLGFEDDRFNHLIKISKQQLSAIQKMETIEETKKIELFFKDIIKNEYPDGYYSFDFEGNLSEMRGIELHSDTVYIYRK